ncbi:hypothetical protein JCM5353_007650 [Sporobolomyces roseus]
MSDEIKRDYISLLPPELLSEIFYLVTETSASDLTPLPISRVLSSPQQAALYRIIANLPCHQFPVLVRCIINRPKLGGLLRYLSLSTSGQMGASSERDLKTMISTLSNIETLLLGPWDVFTEIFPDPKLASSLPKLTHIDLGEGKYSKTDIRDEFGNIALYPSLTSLDLFLHDKIPQESLSWGKALPKIETLVLTNLRQDPKANAQFILNRFPNKLTPIVSATSSSLPSPSFPSLTYLYLARFTFTPEIGISLRKLPHLETLGFGPGAILEEERMKALAIGSSRIVSLKTILLDQVKGTIGWSAKEDRILHDDHAESQYHVAPDWEKPRFDFGGDGTFTVDGVEEMVAEIQEAGITVEGTVIQAIKVERQWQEEVKLCAELWERDKEYQLEMELEAEIEYALEEEANDPGFADLCAELRAEVGEDIWDGNVSDDYGDAYM